MKITFKSINAVDESPKKDITEIAEEKSDNLENDFDYIMSGIDKLFREGMYDKAIAVIDMLSASFDTAISDIGDNFTSETIESTEDYL